MSGVYPQTPEAVCRQLADAYLASDEYELLNLAARSRSKHQEIYGTPEQPKSDPPSLVFALGGIVTWSYYWPESYTIELNSDFAVFSSWYKRAMLILPDQEECRSYGLSLASVPLSQRITQNNWKASGKVQFQYPDAELNMTVVVVEESSILQVGFVAFWRPGQVVDGELLV